MPGECIREMTELIPRDDRARAGAGHDFAARQPQGGRLEPGTRPAASRHDIGRLNDNECILFDEAERESWIIYPPRSRYSFVRRPTTDSTVVEHHPWAPFSDIRDHVVRLELGCAEHGLGCGAYAAVKAAAEAGWDPFR